MQRYQSKVELRVVIRRTIFQNLFVCISFLSFLLFFISLSFAREKKEKERKLRMKSIKCIKSRPVGDINDFWPNEIYSPRLVVCSTVRVVYAWQLNETSSATRIDSRERVDTVNSRLSVLGLRLVKSVERPTFFLPFETGGERRQKRFASFSERYRQ